MRAAVVRLGTGRTGFLRRFTVLRIEKQIREV